MGIGGNLSSGAGAGFLSVPLRVSETALEVPVISATADQRLEIPDDVLLSRIQEGDKEGLSHLFRRYARIVRSVGERIVRDKAEAEDVVQETFLYIFRKAGVYNRLRCPARSWILQVGYSQALQRRRHLVSRGFYQSVELEGSGAQELIDPLVPEYDASLEGIFGREGWKKVLESLSEGQRETLRMHFFEGCTLATIYKRQWTELATFFGVDSGEVMRDQDQFGLPRTHLTMKSADADSEKVVLPLRALGNLELEQTNLLTRLAAIWGEIPISLVKRLNPQESVYGLVGLKDFRLYPLLRPGTFVQIDQQVRKIQPLRWRTEYDRPIYFVESREGYYCSWCELQGGQLLLLPHPLSPCGVKRFTYGVDADIVGRVTGIAMRIVEAETAPPAKSPGGDPGPKI